MKPALNCCVRDAEVRRDVHRAAASCGSSMVDVDLPLRPPSRKRPLPSGLVYDLAPWDESALEAVHGVRRDFPALPIFLVVPSRETAAELLLQCGTLPCVHGVLHGPSSHERVKDGVIALLATAPTTVLRKIVLALFPGIPERGTDYVARVVDGLQEERDSVRVGDLLPALSLTPRIAERAFAEAGLPRPKRLADWLTLLLIALTAERGLISLGEAARHYGYDPNEYYRLRQRVLPPALRDLPAGAPQAFDLTLLAFAEACGVSRDRALAAIALDATGVRQKQA
jgi:hypothetical protein